MFLLAAGLDVLVAVGALPGLFPPEVSPHLRGDALLVSAGAFAVAGGVLLARPRPGAARGTRGAREAPAEASG